MLMIAISIVIIIVIIIIIINILVIVALPFTGTYVLLSFIFLDYFVCCKNLNFLYFLCIA